MLICSIASVRYGTPLQKHACCLGKNEQGGDQNLQVTIPVFACRKSRHGSRWSIERCKSGALRLKILPLQSQYLLSLLLFVAENTDYFGLNSEIHGFNTKNKCNLHLPPTKLTIFQKGPYYSGIKAFNNLPTYIKKTFSKLKNNSSEP